MIETNQGLQTVNYTLILSQYSVESIIEKSSYDVNLYKQHTGICTVAHFRCMLYRLISLGYD